jgi:hypothetical protein
MIAGNAIIVFIGAVTQDSLAERQATLRIAANPSPSKDIDAFLVTKGSIAIRLQGVDLVDGKVIDDVLGFVEHGGLGGAEATALFSTIAGNALKQSRSDIFGVCGLILELSAHTAGGESDGDESPDDSLELHSDRCTVKGQSIETLLF